MSTPTSQPPIGARLLAWVRGISWGGLLVSLAIHGAILLTAALFVIPQLIDLDPEAITVVAGESEQGVSFDEIANLDELTSLEEVSQGVEIIPVAPVDTTAINLFGQKTNATQSGKPDADGSGDGIFAAGSSRLLQPDNAVSKGRFSAWTIPIARPGETFKPGDAPLVGRSYYIVVQMQVPKTYRTYPANDLKGSVEGSDTYRLRIPNRTYYYNARNELNLVTPRSRIPVNDGVVQMLVNVPGASDAGVRDEIELESRRLKESETLTIVFAAKGTS